MTDGSSMREGVTSIRTSSFPWEGLGRRRRKGETAEEEGRKERTASLEER
jgi:hypothetical protein